MMARSPEATTSHSDGRSPVCLKIRFLTAKTWKDDILTDFIHIYIYEFLHFNEFLRIHTKRLFKLNVCLVLRFEFENASPGKTRTDS